MDKRLNQGATKSWLPLLGFLGALVVVTALVLIFLKPFSGDEKSFDPGFQLSESTSPDRNVESGTDDQARDRSRLLPQGPEGERVHVAGKVTLQGGPLTGVPLEAFSDLPEKIPPSMAENIRSSPFFYDEQGAALREILENEDTMADGTLPDAAATCTLGKDGGFDLSLVPSDTVTFRLDHDFYFFPGTQAGPFSWSTRAGQAELDRFSGRLDADLGALVKGTVVDRNNLPLEGVFVELMPVRDGFGGMGRFFPGGNGNRFDPGQVVRTDKEGSYVFRGVDPTLPVELEARLVGFAPASSERTELVRGQVARVDLRLFEGATIRALVKNFDGKPVQGAEVFLSKEESDGMGGRGRGMGMPFQRSAVQGMEKSDAMGLALFSSLAPGLYQVKAYFPGSLETSLESPVAVTEEPRILPVTLTLSQGTFLSGTVKDDAGQPVAKAEVEASEHQSGAQDMRGRFRAFMVPSQARKKCLTKEDGSFLLTGLPDYDGFDLKAGKKGYLSGEAQDLKPASQGLVMVVGRPAAIEGRAVHALDSSPVTRFTVHLLPASEEDSNRFRNRDRGGFGGNFDFAGNRRDRGGPPEPDREESPIQGMMRTFFDSMRGRFSTGQDLTEKSEEIFDPQGCFRIEGIVPGAYRLCIVAEGCAPGVSQKLELKKGETRKDVVVPLEPGASIAGKTLGPSGPVEGALVRAEARGDLTPEEELAMDRVETCESEADGAFLLKGLPKGEYRVRASHADHPSAEADDVVLEKGQALTGLIVEFPPGAAIVGLVLDEKGLPLADARVECRPIEGRGGRRPARTDSQGRFEIRDLQAGAYAVSLAPMGRGFFSRGADTPSTEVTVAEGETREVLIKREPPPGATVRGVIMDQGKPLTEGFLVVTNEDEGETRSTMIEGDGSYVVEGVPEGLCRFTVRFNAGDTFESATLFFDIPDLDEVWQDVHLPGGSLSGTVLDGVTGRPVQDARVVLSPVGEEDRGPGGRGGFMGGFSSARKTANTGADGSFRFSLLGEGDYRIEARFDGGDVEAGTDYYPAAIEGLALAEGQAREGIRLLLFPGGTLEVRVKDKNGDPYSGAMVTVERDESPDRGSRRERTDEEGLTWIAGMEPGAYTVMVQARQMGQEALPGVRITANAVTRRDVTLKEGVAVSLTLKSQAGQDVVGANLVLKNAQGTRLSLPPMRRRGGNRYDLGSLVPGPYVLEATWPEGKGSTTFSVSAPGEIALVL